MSEKRKEHRLRANMPIKLAWEKEKGLLGTTGNISRLGTYVELDRQIPSGQAVELILELPAYTHDISLIGDVSCSGTVFRSSPLRQSENEQRFGLGIFFTDFASPRDKDKISAYVDHLIRMEEQDIKEGLRRRKDREESHEGGRRKEGSARRQEDFQNEALALLKQISSRLDALARSLKRSDKK
jgi:hypothetical protein